MKLSTIVAILACMLAPTPSAGAQFAASQPPPWPRSFGAVGMPYLHQPLPAGRDADSLVPLQRVPDFVTWSRLVFQSYRDGNWEIYRADGDGSNQTRLTDHSASDIDPRLNRGANRIVFSSDRTGQYDVYVMDLSGSGIANLTDQPGHDVAPAWSPDGTRIVFESYRYGDNNAELVVMNADGSNPVRLTSNTSYDGAPSWSPDGAKIAFTSNRSGRYQVWVMNSDGSGPRRLSNANGAFDPAWSPDGQQIAYDADQDSDGWEELWLMDAEGNNRRMIHDPQGQAAAWASGWSADGRHLAFTTVEFVYYQGAWYWTEGRLYAWDSASNAVFQIGGGNEDWQPDWQTLDVSAPTSSLEPLPTISPGPFPVRWSGADSGGSGVKSYDIQVRESPTAPWVNWQVGVAETSASYPGVGGRTYYFRSRARDNSFNVETWPISHTAATTVESAPPITSIVTPPRYLRNDSGVIRWTGRDPGGSAITYDVQYRRSDQSVWQDWFTGVSHNEAAFSGDLATTYYFRVRGTDGAQNQALWPAGTGSGPTTLYNWAVTGNVRDNRGAPITGAGPVVSLPVFAGYASDDAGNYASYTDQWAYTVDVTWRRAGYADLPTTSYAFVKDAMLDVVLPPANNVVQNWGFETGSFGQSWQTGGPVSPAVQEYASHSGRYGAFLGCRPFSSVQMVSSSHSAYYPFAGKDGSGTIHVIWAAYVGASQPGVIYYAHRSPQGVWSSPEQVANDLQVWTVVVEENGTVHIVGSPDDSTRDLLYLRRLPGGHWTGRETITHGGHWPQLAVDGQGTVHVAWSWLNQVRYAQRPAAGPWSATEVLSDNTGKVGIAATPNGFVDVFFSKPLSFDRSTLYHVRRDSAGAWAPIEQLEYAASSGAILEQPQVDRDGTVHLVFWTLASEGGWAVYHARFPESGAKTVNRLGVFGWVYAVAFTVGATGDVHAAVYTSQPRDTIHYTKISPDGRWSPFERVTSEAFLGNLTADLLQISLAPNGVVHIAYNTDDYGIMHAQQEQPGTWRISSVAYLDYGEVTTPRLFTDNQNVAHVVYTSTVRDEPGLIAYTNSAAPVSGPAYFAQSITLPANLAHPTLSFLYDVEKLAPDAPIDFNVQVIDGATSYTLMGEASDTGGWAHRWFDLEPWRGRTVTVQFTLAQQANQPCSNAFVDEISLGTAQPDLWVVAPSGAGTANRQLNLVLTYGNRGGVEAASANVTLQLPPELSLLSASPPPSATTPTLRWNLGNLPAFSQGGIALTLLLSGTTTYGDVLSTTSSITSDTGELETGNNSTQGLVFVGNLRYLPIIAR